MLRANSTYTRKAKDVIVLADGDFRLDWMAFDEENKPVMEEPDCLFDDEGEPYVSSVHTLTRVFDLVKERKNNFCLGSGAKEVLQNVLTKLETMNPECPRDEVAQVMLVEFVEKLLRHARDKGASIAYTTVTKVEEPEDDTPVKHIKLIQHSERSIDFATFDEGHNPCDSVEFTLEGNYTEKSFKQCYSKPRQIFTDHDYDFPAIKELTRLMIKIQDEGGMVVTDKAVRSALQEHQKLCLRPQDDTIKQFEAMIVKMFIEKTLAFEKPSYPINKQISMGKCRMNTGSGSVSSTGDPERTCVVTEDKDGCTRIKITRPSISTENDDVFNDDSGEEEEEERETVTLEQPTGELICIDF